MKNTRSSYTKQSKQGMTHKPLPEIRDNLDSRKNNEYNSKAELRKAVKQDKVKKEK
jgi:hypothetical protein